jgi:hypothetical protein
MKGRTSDRLVCTALLRDPSSIRSFPPRSNRRRADSHKSLITTSLWLGPEHEVNAAVRGRRPDIAATVICLHDHLLPNHHECVGRNKELGLHGLTLRLSLESWCCLIMLRK